VHNRFAIAPAAFKLLRKPNYKNQITKGIGKPLLKLGFSQTKTVVSRKFGAGKESRTLDLNLGKVALYQLSYSRRNAIIAENRNASNPAPFNKTASRRRPFFRGGND
jgi:hypothetical protein